MNLMMWVWILSGAAGILAVVCICLSLEIRKRDKRIKGLCKFTDQMLNDMAEFCEEYAKCTKALYGELRDRCYNIDDVMVRLGIANNSVIKFLKEEFKDECD